MLKKSISKTGAACRVTFKYENEENAETAVVAGEFNDWSLHATPMKKLKDGSFSVTLSLPTGHTYRFRYVLDGGVWVNDTQADDYAPNEYGETNSVLVL
ncbi:isoamylase early set domain-containing protein [Desulfobulbus oligotrophicus]|uniref:Isoamylase early set domain-containing protein n=1 Tax=Desulfobulbus oligotrophicus TaxID=1909699 RepID=A0A7T5VC45_9BACT|nr:isoamylase early set domain-containing protein [Desulfobulbus oligotrophicus]QQG65079.1 isoamylase early set domain-containing protein [Desulfobulbus oligotrophicus]